jgi:uncharacterized protein (DUF433 family)
MNTVAANMDWELFDEPAYTAADVSTILRVPRQTVRYWAFGRKATRARPLIDVPDSSSRALSFANLLECHVLNAMRTTYELDIANVRAALDWLAKRFRDSRRRHPLLTQEFETDGLGVFVDKGAINASKGGQTSFLPLVKTYLRRIEWSSDGLAKFFPFVHEHSATEPKIISMTPAISAGYSVVDGTAISTAVILSRFYARELPEALAVEYRLTQVQVLEAIRWEAQSRQFRRFMNAEAE